MKSEGDHDAREPHGRRTVAADDHDTALPEMADEFHRPEALRLRQVGRAPGVGRADRTVDAFKRRSMATLVDRARVALVRIRQATS